jgi:hypothetical protein
MSCKSKLNLKWYVFTHYTYHFSKFYSISSLMKFDMHALGKRLSKFLSKLFWHFNQVVPTYTDSRRTRSSNRSELSSHEHKSVIDKDHGQIQYSRRCRIHLIRQRHSTLTSIEEENENEIVNCK